MGLNIHDQYKTFRGVENASDISGKQVSQGRKVGENVLVLGNTRFEVTNAAFWVDNVDTVYEVLAPGSIYPANLIPSDVSIVILVGDVALSEAVSLQVASSGTGYVVLERIE